ncbi:hypothetical protein [Sphingomonas sp. VNH70]|uniref:hypothetical protein n=1 Tax=Sphingomonas silueang TaxID=3156617 RepID=UPI0032B5EB7A
MKRGKLLGSAALGMIAAPLGAESAPLTVPVAIAADASARVTIGTRHFTLPDEQAAMAAALQAMPDKDRPVVLSVGGRIDTPYRIVGGLIYLFQSAGFTKVSVVQQPGD